MSKIVNRTLDVFELFAAERRPLALSELTRLLALPVSSCFDVVKALCERGYLYETRARGGFYPTQRIFELGKALADSDPFVAAARALLEGLRTDTGETVLLASAANQDLTYVAVLESQQPIRYSVPQSPRVRSLTATSAGKAYLGMLPVAQRAQLLKSLKLVRYTPATITDRAALLADVAAAEKRGWHVNREESIVDCVTLSTRVNVQNMVFILTIAGPASRLNRALNARVRQMLATRARLERLAEKIGVEA